jgi:putative PIN family toxin of toxin-antitoxin system
MGKKEKAGLRIVLDTNVLVSALLFTGELSEIVALWKQGKITPIFSRQTFAEFRNVLQYPKFSLTEREIKMIIEEEVLPFFEIAEAGNIAGGLCKDPDDDKFLSCAISAAADFIVSGDKDLCSLDRYKSTRIIRTSDFLKMFK